MISVQNLTKTFKLSKREPGVSGFVKNLISPKFSSKAAVNNISFEIEQGQLVGFLGPNGAGKTTTMKMLSGILYPTKGKIKVLGYTPFLKEKEFLKNIAFIMGQRGQLMWELPPMDTFRLNQAIYEISEKDFTETVFSLADLLDGRNLLTQQTKTLSLGQRMKMELIGALIHRPKVLFLDEPTIGLDVVAQKTIREFIQNYQSMYSATVLLTSHYMEDVKKLAERLIIIDKGEILYDGKTETLTKRYAKTKIVELIVETLPKQAIIEKINATAHINFPKIVFTVDRDTVPKVVQQISHHIPFIDMTIEEEKIEEVIRKIFVSGIKGKA